MRYSVRKALSLCGSIESAFTKNSYLMARLSVSPIPGVAQENKMVAVRVTNALVMAVLIYDWNESSNRREFFFGRNKFKGQTLVSSRLRLVRHVRTKRSAQPHFEHKLE